MMSVSDILVLRISTEIYFKRYAVFFTVIRTSMRSSFVLAWFTFVSILKEVQSNNEVISVARS